MQLRECDNVRALTLRECGWSQERVAADLGVHTRTIQRVESNDKKMKKGEIPQRKVGSGSVPRSLVQRLVHPSRF